MVLPAALATTSALLRALAMARLRAASLVCSSVASSTSKEMPLTVLAPLSAMRLTVLPASLMLRTLTVGTVAVVSALTGCLAPRVGEKAMMAAIAMMAMDCSATDANLFFMVYLLCYAIRMCACSFGKSRFMFTARTVGVPGKFPGSVTLETQEFPVSHVEQAPSAKLFMPCVFGGSQCTEYTAYRFLEDTIDSCLSLIHI